MMNIFKKLQSAVTDIHDALVAEGALPHASDLSKVVVELPRDLSHGDLSTNVAMVTAKKAGMNPRELASLYANETTRIR